MSLDAKQRRILLGGALVVTLLGVGWAASDDDAGAEAAVQPPAAMIEVQAAPPADEAVPSLDELQREDAEEVVDVFAYSRIAPPAPTPLPRAPSPVTAESQPLPPPLPFTYVGRLHEDETSTWTVFLSSQGRNYAVQEGDVIEQTYRVDEIQATAVTFTYLPLQTTQSLIIGAMR